jgi:hypothetical protein
MTPRSGNGGEGRRVHLASAGSGVEPGSTMALDNGLGVGGDYALSLGDEVKLVSVSRGA